MRCLAASRPGTGGVVQRHGLAVGGELPGRRVARDLYAVARASSVRRPAVALIVEALTTAARSLPGGARTAHED